MSVTALPQIIDGTCIAGEDLSGKGYCFVKKHTDGTLRAISADTNIPYGVLQEDDREAGDVCTVVLVGGTKLKAGAAINPGTPIGPGSTGKAAARTLGTDTTKHIAGQLCDVAGEDGHIVGAVVNCINPPRAA